MRGPRYRFPEEVRAATRAMASRMVQQETIVQTPEQLESWISEDAGVRGVLERGGYGTAFTAHDLFPLLEVFIDQEGGVPLSTEPLSETPNLVVRTAILIGILLGVAAAVAFLAVR